MYSVEEHEAMTLHEGERVTNQYSGIARSGSSWIRVPLVLHKGEGVILLLFEITGELSTRRVQFTT